MRKQASLLLAHGHPEAHNYPLSFLWEETELVVERINAMLATEAIILQSNLGTIVTSIYGKAYDRSQAKKAFDELLNRLNGGDTIPDTPESRLAAKRAEERQGNGK